MFVLITGTLWRDPVERQSKAGRPYVTALIKAQSAETATWANLVAFDTAAQAELLRLQAGNALSVQGTAKLGVFEKAGEYRASVDVTANHVLALDQPKKAKSKAPDRKPTSENCEVEERAPPTQAAWDDEWPSNLPEARG